jgi:hypothetical protein
MWSAVETMTGNYSNKSLRSRLGEHIARLRSPTFWRGKNDRETAEKAANLRKVTLLFLLDTTLWQHLHSSETSVSNSR